MARRRNNPYRSQQSAPLGGEGPGAPGTDHYRPHQHHAERGLIAMKYKPCKGTQSRKRAPKPTQD